MAGGNYFDHLLAESWIVASFLIWLKWGGHYAVTSDSLQLSISRSHMVAEFVLVLPFKADARNCNCTSCRSLGKSAEKLSVAKFGFGRPPTCQYVLVRVLLGLVVTAFAPAAWYGVASLGYPESAKPSVFSGHKSPHAYMPPYNWLL